MLFLTESQVRELLPISECIEAMRNVFAGLAEGAAANQPRRRLYMPAGTVLHSMAGSFRGYLGTKIYSTHRKGAYFLFLLYEAESGRPVALLEANYLGQIRTGAASGLATGILARPDAATLGLIGAGFQAGSQIEAILAVRPIRSVRVWSRSAGRRRSFVEEFARKFPGLSILEAESAEAAVAQADVIVTATSAKDPVLDAGWISPGAHINAVGSNHPQRRELPAELIHRADRIVADSVEQCRIEAGDLLLALNDSEWQGVVELKDVVSPGRERAPGEITIFKSVGLGVEDVAAASLVFEKARTLGLGQSLPVFYS